MNHLLIAACLLSSAYGLPAADTTCTECVQFLDTLVKNAADQLPTSAEDAHTVCNSLPVDMRVPCLSFIGSGLSSSDVASLRNIKKRHLTNLCTMMGSCKASNKRRTSLNPLVFHGDIIPTNQSLRVGGLSCTICREILGFLHTFLSNPDNQRMVLGVLEEICSLVPFVGHECAALVQEYGALLIHLLESYLNPKLCSTFGLCPKAQVSYINGCELCEVVIGVMFDTVHDPLLKLRVTLTTKYLCSRLELDEKMCEELMTLSEYVPGIVNFMKSHDRFWKFCQVTSMCFPADADGAQSDAAIDSGAALPGVL